ncbi:major facilitator superfamily domain-containing protein [Rhodotorula diobovata]|uniref:Major facilitator superfamily domain-containing protein n=1 Tax=Rhodotorula diobovata TaxID=5288 RepID=A0A5C5FWT2_9BASI|nr:major facilitator superfamily domain-containing protein [Rhodotorula diobovata]
MVEPTLSKEQRDTAINPSPTIAPPMDAELKHSTSRLEHLRISDEELAGKLRYEQLSLYEKKSVLINRELDIMNAASFWGMGRYQWCIFFLCGFGYYLDLCFAQLGGLIGGQIQQELGVSNSRIGDLSTCFSAGMTVGALFWGLAVDIIGRRWAFNITCLISAVFSLIFAAPSNYGALCFLNFMIGLGVGGNIPIDALITLEFLPTNRRFLLCALSTFQPLGVVVTSLICWGLVPRYACDVSLPACGDGVEPCCTRSSNMGWRYATLTVGFMTLAIFILRFVVFTFRESPKFLLSKGRDAEAIDVLYKIAQFNKQPQPQLTIDDFRLLDKEFSERQSVASDEPIVSEGAARPLTTKQLLRKRLVQLVGQFKHLKGFFATKRMVWLSVTLWIAYMSLFFSFSIAGGYLPLILRTRGIDTNVSLDETYRNYVIVYLPGVTATILGAVLMEIRWLGRKYAMAFAAALMGTSLFLYATVSSYAAFVGLNLFEYWAQSLYAALLYAATPEYFPAPFRGSGSGIASTLGRLASTVAPIAAGTIFNPRNNGVLYMAGGAALVSMLAILFLPFDTRGRHTF